MPNCRCPLARWQHIDVWLGECQKCGREIEFNIKMDDEDGRYRACWNRHDCETGGDALLLGEVTWITAETLTSLRGAITVKLVNQRLVSDSQSDVKKKEGERTGEILKDIRAIIRTIGQDEGYTLILENAEGQILYALKEIDLTDLVIRKHNESKAASKK